MLNKVLEYLVVVTLVTTSLLLGRVLNNVVTLLPASLLGMMVFACVIYVGNKTKLIPDTLFQRPMAFILKYLSFVFVPVSVGVMQFSDLIQQMGGKILFVGCISSLFLMSICAYVTRTIMIEKKHD